MQNNSFTAQEKKPNQAILIVDKVGVIGGRLSQELSKDFVVFLLSNRPLSEFSKNIIQSPFKNSVPKVVKNNYTKIFIIDDGNDITRKSVFSFIDNARQINAEVYFLGSIRNIDLKYSDEILGRYGKVKVLVFGDLFDNKYLFDKNSSITKFIIQIRKNKKIEVRGDGLSLNYPINFEDTIKLIIKSIYIKIPKKSILLFSQHPITDISLANTFKKIDPDIDVDFVNAQNAQKLYFPNSKEFALAKYDLTKKLNEIDLSSSDNDLVEYKEDKNNFSFIKPVLFFFLACLFLLSLPLLSTYAYSFLGFSQVNSAKRAADKGDFKKALGKINNASIFFNFAKQTSGPLIYEAELIGLESRVEPVIKNINSGKNLSNASVSLLNGLIKIQNIQTKGDLNESINYLKNANILLQELKATNQFPKQMSEEFQNIMPLVEIVSNSSDVAGDILGFDKEKKYLILFQNNLELRPSGGVVDVVGVLKVKNGKMVGFDLLDVNDLDKKLNVYVEPPFALRRYLPTDNFYLKDSASNSDFVNSAIDASNIYQIISENEIDGIIDLNLGFLNKLLALPNTNFNYSNKKISNDNFLEYAANDKSPSKLNFYKELFLSLSMNFNNNTPYSSLSEIVGGSIEEKEILFAFKDSNIQNIFTVNSLSNALVESRKNEKNLINDFFGISESNLGNNKVNYYISRSVSRELKINENNEFISTAKISFKNNSQNLNYKNYLQIILPIGSKLTEVSVGGRIVDLKTAIIDPNIYEKDNFKSPEGLEVEQVIQKDKIIYGFLVNIPSQAVRVVSVSYSLPFKFDTRENFEKYSLLVYKQPGIESFPFEQIFKLPSDFKVLPNSAISVEIKKDEIFNSIISQEK